MDAVGAVYCAVDHRRQLKRPIGPMRLLRTAPPSLGRTGGPHQESPLIEVPCNVGEDEGWRE
jgi:hypothetical protein